MNLIYPGDYVSVIKGGNSLYAYRDGLIARILDAGDVLRVSSVGKDDVLATIFLNGKKFQGSLPFDKIRLIASPEPREIHIGDRVLIKRNNVGAGAKEDEAVTVLSLKKHEYKDNDALGPLIWFQPIYTGYAASLHYVPLKDVELVGVDVAWHNKNLKENEINLFGDTNDSISRAS